MQLKAKIKVIIAEDEPAIMHTIATKIQEIDSDFLIVEQCTNGLDALQAVHLHRPDVLLTDIKMPVMDGLDLAKNTSLQYPNTRIVIISGYSDFSYSQEAIRYGVFSYLVKPIESAGLQTVLQDLKRRIIHDQYHDVHTTVFSPNYAANPNLSRAHCLFSACIGNLLYDVSDSFLLDRYAPCRSMRWETILSDLVPYDYDWFVSEEAPNIFTICLRGSNLYSSRISEAAEEIQRRLRGLFPGAPVSIAFFHAPQQQKDIWMCTRRLQNLIQQRVVPAQSFIFIAEKEEFSKPLGAFSIVKTRVNNQLCRHISDKNVSGIRQELSLIFNYMVSHQVTQQDFQKVILFIMRTCEFAGLSADDTWTRKVMQQLCTCFEKEKLPELLINLTLQSLYPETIAPNLDEALLSYIDSHYLQLNQLEDLSLVFHYSYAYLSRLFRKRTGVSINKYVMEKRLELSKQLIENNNDMSISEIAELSGFSDRRNFLRAFASYTSMSPSEYKASLIPKG